MSLFRIDEIRVCIQKRIEALSSEDDDAFSEEKRILHLLLNPNDSGSKTTEIEVLEKTTI